MDQWISEKLLYLANNAPEGSRDTPIDRMEYAEDMILRMFETKQVVMEQLLEKGYAQNDPVPQGGGDIPDMPGVDS